MPENEEEKEITQFSKFNMSIFDMRRLDESLRVVHSVLSETKYLSDDPSCWVSLTRGFRYLMHSAVIIKYAVHKDDRQAIDRKLDSIQTEIKRFETDGKITKQEFEIVFNLMFAVLERLYSAKQMVNLGFPIDKYKGAEQTLRDAVNR